MKRVVQLLVAGLLAACVPSVLPSQPITPKLVSTVALDTSPKEPARLVPPEVMMRTYVRLFGAQTPLESEKIARGNDGRNVFDAWSDYLSALGLPDYRNDLPRANQTNALMVATFERVAEALCDRAIERDLRGKLPTAQRTIFSFDLPQQPLDRAAFTPRFESLHRTFLGYPVGLAPAQRADDFYALYRKVSDRHAHEKSRLTPSESGMAAVCVAFARHPELHFY